MTLTFLSLYSGCGGLDLGFQAAGFQCLGAYDIDNKALEIHSKNLGAPTITCDLSLGKLPTKLARAPAVILSGSPCQGFSTIGKRLDNDARNHLLVTGAQIV